MAMASIIRRDQSKTAGQDERSSVFNFDDVAKRAETYLQGVKQKAAEILAEAESEAERIREKSRVEGLQQARKEANAGVKALVAEQMKVMIPNFQSKFDAIAAERDNWLHRWENDAIELSIKIAEQLTLREFEREPASVALLVREALEFISNSHQVEIHLNPKDRSMMSVELDNIVAGLRRVATVTFVEDPSIERGGCRVLSEHGEIDQQQSTRLARITEELLGD